MTETVRHSGSSLTAWPVRTECSAASPISTARTPLAQHDLNAEIDPAQNGDGA